MHSFPQFTRSTLWGEFAWVGAIIFEGNFLVRWQFSSGQLSGGGRGGSYPRGKLSRGQLSGGQSSRRQLSGGEQFSSGANCPKTKENSYEEVHGVKWQTFLIDLFLITISMAIFSKDHALLYVSLHAETKEFSLLTNFTFTEVLYIFGPWWRFQIICKDLIDTDNGEWFFNSF